MRLNGRKEGRVARANVSFYSDYCAEMVAEGVLLELDAYDELDGSYGFIIRIQPGYEDDHYYWLSDEDVEQHCSWVDEIGTEPEIELPAWLQ